MATVAAAEPATEPSVLAASLRPSWSNGDLTVQLSLPEGASESMREAARRFLPFATRPYLAPPFADSTLGARISVEKDLTVVFPTARARTGSVRKRVIACVDAWYGTLSGLEKTTLDALLGDVPGVPDTTEATFASSAAAFVQSREADCGEAAPSHLSESLIVDVPRYVDLKEAGAPLASLTRLERVLAKAHGDVTNAAQTKHDAAVLVAVRAWALTLRGYGFATDASPRLNALLSEGATNPPPRGRASFVLDVLRAATTPEKVSAALKSGDMAPLKAPLHLAETLLGACIGADGTVNATRCSRANASERFFWLEVKNESGPYRILLPRVPGEEVRP